MYRISNECSTVFEPTSSDRQISLSICRHIADFYKAAKLIAPGISRACEKDVWTQFHEENRFTFTNDVLFEHMFHLEFRNIQYSAPGKVTAL